MVAAPLAAPFVVASLYVLAAASRGHPTRTLLTTLALGSALVGLLLDAISGDLLIYRALVELAGFPAGPVWLYEVFEESAEQMAAAALAVVLLDMLAPSNARGIPTTHRRAVPLVMTVVLLAVCAVPLKGPHVLESDRYVHTWVFGVGQSAPGRPSLDATKLVRIRPQFYAGPLTLVEQPFRTDHDHLTRIDVWAYVDGGATGATSHMFARLTPGDSDRPIRESRAEVRGSRFSDAAVTFDFEPIPDSGGTRYTLAVGVLNGPQPYVHVGLTDGDLIPEGAASINGAPTRYANDLAMRTYRIGRFVEALAPQDPRHWWLYVEALLYVALWVLMAVIAWTGLPTARRHFWRGVALPAVGTSVLVTVVVLILVVAGLALGSPTRLG